ncbi:MAG: hypothetical protein GVY20_15955, partial [Bacteroidetes bacterium]|nr:hypothetical protein [Bacteroidota bacterium]
WRDLAEVVNQHAPEAFYSVEDVKHVSMIDEEAYTQKQDLISRMLKLKKGI